MDKYFDVRNMIFKGFIPLRANLDGVSIVFKSISEVELEEVRDLLDESDYLSNLYYLFFSIYKVGGVNLFTCRDKYIELFVQSFKKICRPAFEKVFDQVLILNKRAMRSIDRVEAFSYEPESRFLWPGVKGKFLNSPLLTGIEGTQHLGINQCQKLWIFLNDVEDKREVQEVIWENAKFVASAINPKGIKKIEAADKRRRMEEEERRKRVREGKEYRPSMFKIETREELAEELEKQMRGEKDKHDLVVEQYEKKLKEQAYRRMLEIEKIRKRQEKMSDRDFLVGSEKFLTDEEFIEIAQRKKKVREERIQKFQIQYRQSKTGLHPIIEDAMMRREVPRRGYELDEKEIDRVQAKMVDLSEEEKERIRKEVFGNKESNDLMGKILKQHEVIDNLPLDSIEDSGVDFALNDMLAEGGGLNASLYMRQALKRSQNRLKRMK